MRLVSCREKMLIHKSVQDLKCKLNISLFLTLPHPLYCPIHAKDIIVIVLLLQMMEEWKGWRWLTYFRGQMEKRCLGIICFLYFCPVLCYYQLFFIGWCMMVILFDYFFLFCFLCLCLFQLGVTSAQKLLCLFCKSIPNVRFVILTLLILTFFKKGVF